MLDKSQIPNPKSQTKKFWSLVIWSLAIVWNLMLGYWNLSYLYAQDNKEESIAGSKSVPPEPIIVNGDTVEYSTDNKEVTATGNVLVIYKGTTLTCDKLTVNTETKDGEAEGNVRLDDKKGVIEGAKIKYNFQTKTGTIIDSDFRANPYFGKAEKVNKVSDAEFIALRGYMSTCGYDNPHYRIKSRRMTIFPGDKIQTKDNTFYVGRAPFFYLPQYNHSLRDPLVHVQLMPGKSKEWGYFLLTAWRYNINEYMKGRIYLDYREKLGVAEGFGLNYTSQKLGKGDFKYYYTQERSRFFKEGIPAEFQRYFIRWRHKWNIDERTDLTSEYYKIVDSKMVLHGSQYNILKDYFFREYEKDTQPLSYVLLHHAFDYSSLDITVQKRINRWYSQEEKLPQIIYSLPSFQIGETPFYFENTNSYINFNQKTAVPSASWNDVTYNKFDMNNRFSLPMKIAFINLTPFVSAQQVYYDKSTYGSTLQLNFSGGANTSTKFYRIFNAKTNFFGLDINGLRHIITPTASYVYSNNSTTPSGDLRVGGGAAVPTDDAVSLELSNKLQTKRKGQSVDIVDFKVSSNYNITPKTGTKRGSSFSDFLFELKLLPYSWMSFNADTTYNHYADYFSQVDCDINFGFGNERSVAFGERYQRKGGKELTFHADWRINPKWKFGIYERYQFARSPGYKRGLREQEYFLSRDLHCWTVEVTYNVTRGIGESIWFIFRLKAFPEMEFGFDQTYHQPKFGSQSNP